MSGSCDQLQQRAERLQSLLRQARRPFVLEFAGAPKAGKTTSVEAISHFFRRTGFNTHVLRERASFCPITMKGHLYFNTWCSCTMLAEMLENVEAKKDIIIKDRGLFDSLIWLRRQVDKGEVTNEELEKIEDFLLLERWTVLVNAVVVLKADPEMSMQRENEGRIIQKSGSIMNSSALDSILAALDQATEKYRSHFEWIHVYDTTRADPIKTNAKIVEDIIDQFESFVDPEIAVIDREQLNGLESCSSFEQRRARGMVEFVREKVRYVRRSLADRDPNCVQIVVCAAMCYKHQLFIFERDDSLDKSKEHGRCTIWQTGRLEKRDGRPFDALVQASLDQRLREKLFLGRQLKADSVGFVWEANDPRKSKYISIMYKLIVDTEGVANDLRKKEFRGGRNAGTGNFAKPADLVDRLDAWGFESWSRAALTAKLPGSW